MTQLTFLNLSANNIQVSKFCCLLSYVLLGHDDDRDDDDDDDDDCSKRKCIHTALISVVHAWRSGVDHSFTCNYTSACLYLISVHQMAPPQTEVADI